MSLIKGLDSFQEILELIKNPSKFDAKVNELQLVVGRYTAAVEAVTKLSEVNEYTQSIRQREEDSKKALEDAKAEADTLVVAAKAKADGMIKQAQEATQKAAGDSEMALARVSAAIVREQLLEASEASLAKAWEDFKVKDKLLSDLGDELTERKNKLLAAMG
jgi:cell division septum initiation protein DivIVA